MKKLLFLIPLILCVSCVDKKTPPPPSTSFPENSQEKKELPPANPPLSFFEERKELSIKELEFAARLFKNNRELFCKKFSPKQRKEAMELAEITQFITRERFHQKAYIQVHVNPNSAVEKVYKNP